MVLCKLTQTFPDGVVIETMTSRETQLNSKSYVPERLYSVDFIYSFHLKRYNSKTGTFETEKQTAIETEGSLNGIIIYVGLSVFKLTNSWDYQYIID